ncbi:MAG: bifunctional transaldolase/phosoglucose isomerase [Chloroflexi bacterium]|nr:bifunctional transaldolase/phosoglucose isomerase [Chloroflexota bacterium]
MANPPVDVQHFGQSIWYDNIERSLITSGELKRMVAEDGVLGITSNPTIFEKAINSSSAYDEAIKQWLDEDASVIFERLAIEDIQTAADILRPVYERTNAIDGYISLEVSPLIAHDTATTLAEAQRLFAAVNRPNLMIKIPATPEGIPAIEDAIAAGVNINVTLIFSVKNYEQVAEAFMRGLERRLEAGQSVTNIASVASFFLSRIDTMVDRMLENNIRAAQGRDLGRVAANSKLLGKAAITNAKAAYRSFKKIFYGQRFARLRAAGAQVQRPLWASTSTKNPAYADTIYIDTLIGRDTVNTLPPAALKAFKDHGKVAETLEDGLNEVDGIFDMLAEVGVDMEQVTKRLQDDGVEAFSESYRSLLGRVEAKRSVLATGIMERQRLALGIYGDDVQRALADLEKAQVNARIWAHDGSAWKDHGPTIGKIEQRLGWLDVLKTIDMQRLKAFQASVKGQYTHAVLLGMGGSSLAPEILSRTYGSQPGFPTLLVLDSTDPARVLEITRQIDPQKTLFIVASKSGSTIEIWSFFKHFWEHSGHSGQHFVAITDSGSMLENEAKTRGFKDIFINPSDIGGRYSALSYFGMLPAALLGLDLDRLWGEAQQMIAACNDHVPANQHPGLWLGAIMAVLGQKGLDKLSILCGPSVTAFGDWAEQLIAESIGKEGKGILPVVGSTPGKPHDYSTDRVFVYLKVDTDDNTEMDAAVRTLREAGHPRVVLQLRDSYALAGEFFRWEFATAVAGRLYGINPFDEPNVTESKDNTKRLLEYFDANGHLPQSQPFLSEGGVSLYVDEQTLRPLRELASAHGHSLDSIAGVLETQMNATRAGDYFALLAFWPPSDALYEGLNEARRKLRHATRRAVTVGFGPRFLHSTGQLHKGGPNTGVFIQLTCPDGEDLAIPGEKYSFGVLKAAQAAGDFEALQGKQRRALRLHGAPADCLAHLLKAIEQAALRRK